MKNKLEHELGEIIENKFNETIIEYKFNEI